jgi:hypothetical protein
MSVNRREYKLSGARLRQSGLRVAIMIAAIGGLTCSTSFSALLLNDTWADADRTNTNLPNDSATWIGQTSGNGTTTVTAGALNFSPPPSNSLKVWEYFTSDNSAPDANQPHNSVTQLPVGKQLLMSASFQLQGVTATTGKNFRFGLFFDPTDARVESDTNSDGGGGTSPWTDATGYAIQLPLSSASNSNPFLIEKRTVSNSSLLGSSGAYTAAPTGGQAYSMANNTTYTLQLLLNAVSASQLDVTGTLLQGNTVLATQTVSDLGSTFGGTAVSGALPGNTAIYTKFDQLFFRNSDNTQASSISFSNWRVELLPEPTSAVLLGLVAACLACVPSRSR